MKIKVCGLTLPEQVNALEEMGVDLIGFIFYPKSPRFIGSKISPERMKKIGGRLPKVGVFANDTYENIMQTVERYRLDIVQLHGDETERFCDKVSDYVTVIKAFRLGVNEPVEWIARSFNDYADMFMFDTIGIGYGGTGKKLDLDILKGKQIDKLFLLSGGIEPGDEESLLNFANDPVAKKLFAIDLSNRFEIGVGVMDMNKIQSFINVLRK
jgi:phosphoribosylanthranilate isomerase